MKQRIISSIIGLPILIALIMSKNTILIKTSILIIIVIGLMEFYKSFEEFDMRFGMIGIVFSIIYLMFFTLKDNSQFGLFIFLFSVSLIFYSIIFYKKTNIRNATITFISFFYITYTLSFILQIINLKSYGSILVWLVFIIAWSGDTFACLVGRRFGKLKLAPVVSPKKSIEGFISGILGASVFSCIYGLLALNFFEININNFLIICIALGIIGSIVSQFGDLAASLIKRSNNVKDFGKLIPGHGGVIDRFDSIILLAPLVYYVFIFFI